MESQKITNNSNGQRIKIKQFDLINILNIYGQKRNKQSKHIHSHTKLAFYIFWTIDRICFLSTCAILTLVVTKTNENNTRWDATRRFLFCFLEYSKNVRHLHRSPERFENESVSATLRILSYMCLCLVFVVVTETIIVEFPKYEIEWLSRNE